MSRSRLPIAGHLCDLGDRRCLKGCSHTGSAFAGTGGHAPGCPVAVEHAKQRIAAGCPLPNDVRLIAKAISSDALAAFKEAVR